MEYNANSVQQLTFREGVRERIGIYLGSADHTGVLAGLLELVNNATDEALVCDTANKIELEIGKDWASCRDYGRGMPHGPNNFSNEVMINLLTENHSGAKFNDNAYGGKSRGLNGCGSGATCCSSDWFKISSYRDGAEWYMEFEEGIPKWQECQKKPLNGQKTGTYIIYKPSQSVFKSEPIHFDYDEICDQMKEYSYFNKGISFIVKNAETKEVRTFLSKNGLIDFAKEKITKPIHKTPLMLSISENDIDVELILQWTANRNEDFYLFSNGGENENGGTPITGIRTAITNFFKKRLKGESSEIARKGLVYVCSVNLKDPIYDGQTKSKITNPELRGLCQRATTKMLEDFEMRHKDEFDKIIEVLTKEMKAEAAAERARVQVLTAQKELSNEKKKRAILADKLKDCQIHGSESGSVLTICEGDSALGALVQARPIDKIALLPIRGKIISALKHDQEKILQNDEVKAIFSALGCGFFDKYDQKKLRYQYVAIASDGDVDGSSIANLITTLFYYMCPDFIKQGRLFRMKMPLFVLKYKSGDRYAFSEDERDEIIKKYGKPSAISRKKGIGENTPEETAVSVFGEQKRWERVNINNFEEYSAMMEMLMGTKVDERRDFIMNNVDFSDICE